MISADDLLVASRQQELAKTGQAANQCLDCGSYRLDGMPPLLHERGCPQRRVSVSR
jgi:hypothetical protein